MGVTARRDHSFSDSPFQKGIGADSVWTPTGIKSLNGIVDGSKTSLFLLLRSIAFNPMAWNTIARNSMLIGMVRFGSEPWFEPEPC